MSEETMTPEQIFAEINRNLNLLMEHEGYNFGFQPPDPFQDEEVGSYLLGVFNDDTGTMDVVKHIRYSDDTDRYEVREGNPDE